MSEDIWPPASFSGTARLFPLPNLVLFPQVVQPLHIFEPRYRQMTADALNADRLIALVLLAPGWEADYTGRPSLHQVGCLGKIVADHRLEDGRFNILLRGLTRIRIGAELPADKLYRSARAEVLADSGLPPKYRERALRRALTRWVPAWLPDQDAALEQLQKLLTGGQSLSAVIDILAFALPLDGEIKQELLETAAVEERARLLIRHVAAKKPETMTSALAKKFPPYFSAN